MSQLLCQLQRRLAHCQNVDLEEEEEVLIRGEGGRESSNGAGESWKTERDRQLAR